MSLLNNIIPEKCGEACGYAAAIVAAVCFGSFGVPVKSDVVSRLDVDPLVMQVGASSPSVASSPRRSAAMALS
jgi:hypothetical protein